MEVRDPETLLKHWAERYSGAAGQEFGWYSVAPIVEQTLKAAEVATLLEVGPLVSGDVAADRIAPWKLPTRGRLYTDGPIDLAGDGFVPAPLHDATLVICVPRDPTLWKSTAVGNFPVCDDVTVADPAVVYWDVRNSNDIDSLEAANHLASLVTGHFYDSLDQNQNNGTERR
ncbi:hypothetical protein GCM10009720_04090 [Yaniella flava]|uniref:Uncharacterized protein n=1 Tax=Yaniella flava TaxID=287930 RepID=A0ABP5FIZ1_9MICC